ncbi:hypothetical protein HPP92_012309 [Vanilla planifolia]|uniref:Uncharacterized protein n=1 Tax=Vanilla planifolia TaxID=51239 RepID=A0A835V381_VANPL|nr:hypothetical protein HPP92_012309 [Vanilla planifolia]
MPAEDLGTSYPGFGTKVSSKPGIYWPLAAAGPLWSKSEKEGYPLNEGKEAAPASSSTQSFCFKSALAAPGAARAASVPTGSRRREQRAMRQMQVAMEVAI